MERELTEKIIGAAIEVHRYWGPGLMESVYSKSLIHELSEQGPGVQREVPIHLSYKGLCVADSMRIDLLVENRIILELKAVSDLAPIHEAQLLTYMKLTTCRIGLLINFNNTKLINGIKRFVI